MRTFETRVTPGLSVHDYTKLRMDLAFGEFCANMENQILEVQLHETDDGTVHRSMSKKFKESPVPPLLRGLAGAIGVTPAHMQFTLEERFNPERFSSTSPMKVSSRLPGSFAEARVHRIAAVGGEHRGWPALRPMRTARGNREFDGWPHDREAD